MNEKKQFYKESTFWLRLIGIIFLIVAMGLIISTVFGGNSVADFFKKLSEINIWLIIGTVVILIAGLVLLFIQNKKPDAEETQTVPLAKRSAKWRTKELVTAALCIALSFVLSYIKIWEMPMGGAITPASTLPIILFAYIYGTGKGLIVSLAYAILQIIQGVEFYSFIQFMLDYIFGFGVLGFGGLFQKNIVWGVLFANFLRFMCSFVSGFVFFAQYAPEGMNPMVYSLVYNGSFMLPDTLICVIITILPGMQSNINALMRKNRAIAPPLGNETPAQ